MHSPNLKRRQLLSLALAELGTLAVAPAMGATETPPSPVATGCCLLQGGEKLIAQSRLSTNYSPENLLKGSGDARFDRALGIVLADLSARFDVRPGFGYFDDMGNPNALAMPDSRLSESRGTVLFGREMLKQSLLGDHGDMFVMGICAHEFAHIVQFFSGFYERLSRGQRTKKFVELHADFLSGYYIGLRNTKYSPKELIALGRHWENIGDSSYTDPAHHGTPEQRLSAVEQGFRFARERPEFRIQAACEVGARYLRIS